MVYVASELGNMGEYQFATDLEKKILKESLMCKRVWVIDNILYNIAWNEGELQSKFRKSVDNEKMTEGIKQCVLLSHFCKQTFHEKFYYDKLHQS